MKGSNSTREIYERTGGRCHFCGDPLAPHGLGKKGDGGWEKDHIRHRAHGGEKGENLLPACRPCNRLRWFSSGRRIREILEFGLIASSAASPDTEIGQQLLRLRHRWKRTKARRSGRGGKLPADPVLHEIRRRREREQMKTFLRRSRNRQRFFSASEIASGTGVPKARVRSLLGTELGINVELRNGQYVFQARPPKRRRK